ncbi:MAG TPA: substrate-binding domain-containing protein [Armatimonadaceae bacterium]|nr:substrate-binding domain-containing protein [Armatimonadaceae bacterium]
MRAEEACFERGGDFPGWTGKDILAHRAYPPAFPSAPHRIRTIGVFVDQAWQERVDSGSVLASLGIRRHTNLGERAGIGTAVLRGVRATSDRKDFRLLLLPNALSAGGDASAVLRRLHENGIAGLILGPGYADTHATRLADAGVPVVLLMQEAKVPQGCGAVGIREEQMVERALRHLWDRGHRRIAFLSDCVQPDFHGEDGDGSRIARACAASRGGDAALRRFGAYIAFMKANRVQNPSLYGFAGGPGAERQAGLALARWESLDSQRPTAVFCPTPEVAHAFLGAARRRGISIPSDLSVMATDTEDAIFARTDQPLTSVQLPAEQIGREAARILLAMLADHQPESEGVRVVLPVENVVDRGSVATLN